MKNGIIFNDATAGLVSIADQGKKYITTKDSSSKSGHSLIANIEMTHSGIVTRNLGFYLPKNMKDGANSFMKDFNKPVILGHDDEADPVGRVIHAKYIDSSSELRMNDKYLASLYEFHDKKKRKKEDFTDFVKYIVSEFWGKDGYRGLGHIRGTVKISDEEAIAKILDERYLTVSTSMSSNAARCSECGQDWVSEGPCDHERGQVYDSGIPTLLVPDSMRYNHLGIVTEPADVYAAGFSNIKLIKNGKEASVSDSHITEEFESKFEDKYTYAANLFGYKDSKLVSLSSDDKIDLIEVKNDIQNLEDSLTQMENKDMKKLQLTLDGVQAVINLYTSGEDENGEYSSSEVSVRKYVSELDEAMLSEMAKKAMNALDSKEFETEEEFNDAVFSALLEEATASESSENTEETTEDSANGSEEVPSTSIKVINDKFKLVDGETTYADSAITDKIEEIKAIEDHGLNAKEVRELANAIVRAPLNDALYYNHNSEDFEKKDLTEIISDFKTFTSDRIKLSDSSETEILSKINEFLGEDNKITEESFSEISDKECAGSGKYFPILTREMADAAKSVLAITVMSDSLRGRILGNIEKLALKLPEASESTENDSANFDKENAECHNQVELSDNEVISKVAELIKVADEREIDLGLNSDSSEKDQEIEILEQQLDSANDEIDELQAELKLLKDDVKKDLVEEVLQEKIKKGLIEEDSLETEREEHLTRSEDSLSDMLSDLVKVEDKKVKTTDLETIDNPTINDNVDTSNEVQDKESNKIEKRINRSHALLRANKGQKFADTYMNKFNK